MAELKLDCWVGNEVLQRSYLNAGFIERGIVDEGDYLVRCFSKSTGLMPADAGYSR